VPFGSLSRVADDEDRAGIGLGVVLQSIEADLVPVGIVLDELHLDLVTQTALIPSPGPVQVADRPEQRMIAGRHRPVPAEGCVATTLEAVAKRARVGARTVYLRFGTKAALFKRVVDVAIVGATEHVDVLGREWAQAALTAPTGREPARHAHAVFWTRMADDGLLDPAVDLNWLIETSSILAAAETYLLITRLTGWDLDTCEDWLATTSFRLARPPEGNL